MNEKLRQLAMQASDPVYTPEGLEYQVNINKLYELIVVECAGVADQKVKSKKSTGKRILEHFGVSL